jgi:hypothetical protein
MDTEKVIRTAMILHGRNFMIYSNENAQLLTTCLLITILLHEVMIVLGGRRRETKATHIQDTGVSVKID